MNHRFRIARWESFKLRQRRMSWILLAIFLLFSQLAVWDGYTAYSSEVAAGGRVFQTGRLAPDMPRMVRCNDLRADPLSVLPPDAPQALEALTR